MESYILMNNYSNILFPEIISETFPILDGASYLHQLASLVQFCPDTAFHIFDTKNGHFHVLVMTDYPDPYHQANELEQISGEYKIELLHLIKPHTNDQRIEIRENDNLNELFYVDDPKSYYRYYLAEAKPAAGW